MAESKGLRLIYRRGRRPKGFVLKRRKPDRSSFQYQRFPQTIHGRAVLRHGLENTVVQKILIKVMRELNRLSLDTSISLADREGYVDGQIEFEVGIANETYFNYLDSLEERMINEIMTKQGTLPIVDFLTIAKYLVKDQDRHPVRTDSYLLRFIASEYSMEVYLSHEKGIRRLNPDELLIMIAKALDRELRTNYNTGVKIESIRTA